MYNKTVILFSSGRESLLNLYRELASGTSPKDIHLVCVNYGQKAWGPEFEGTVYYANKTGCKWHSVDLRGIGLNVPPSLKGESAANNDMVLRNPLIVFAVLNKHCSDPNTNYRVLVGYTKQEAFNDGCTAFWQPIRDCVAWAYPNITIHSHVASIWGTNTIIHLRREVEDLSYLWLCDNAFRGGDGTHSNPYKMCGVCFKCTGVYPQFAISGAFKDQRIYSRYLPFKPAIPDASKDILPTEQES